MNVLACDGECDHKAILARALYLRLRPYACFRNGSWYNAMVVTIVPNLGALTSAKQL